MVGLNIDDEYFFGKSFLVAPVLNKEGIRNIYLPEGKWVDLWSGEVIKGSRWLKDIASPLEKMPVFVKYNSEIPVYPEIVQSTKEFDMSKVINIKFGKAYAGFSNSILGEIIDL